MAMKIQTKLRAQDVTRWNIVTTVRKQSLAEHLFNTAILVEEICDKMGISAVSAMHYALYHDMEEIITGDIPSPTKKRAKEAGVDLNSLLASTMDGPTSPRAYPPSAKEAVKAADLLENLWYIEQYGHGRHANEVKLRLHAELVAGEGPEYEAAREVYHDLTHGVIVI